MIEFKNVHFSYESEEGNVPALKDINLTVNAGEFIALIGPNGSGKSTLSKLINVLLLPTSGSVTVDGLVTTDEKNVFEIRKKAGMVFQNPDNQMVASIVEDDVAFGPENLGVPPKEIRKRVDAALTTVDMLKYADKAPHLLSGGQKQRVAIAGVLAIDPNIIVLDEATAMLDPEGRAEVMETVKKLNCEGKTIIHVTHYMEEVRYATRAVLLNAGRIVFDGPPRELFSDRQLVLDSSMALPVATEVWHRLKLSGLDLGETALTVEELAEEICRSV